MLLYIIILQIHHIQNNYFLFQKQVDFLQIELSYLFISCDNLYNVSHELGKRGISLGSGKKSDFTKDLAGSPSPSAYAQPSFIDLNKLKKKGYTLGSNRESSPDKGIITVDNLKNPGVGNYNIDNKRNIA